MFKISNDITKDINGTKEIVIMLNDLSKEIEEYGIENINVNSISSMLITYYNLSRKDWCNDEIENRLYDLQFKLMKPEAENVQNIIYEINELKKIILNDIVIWNKIQEHIEKIKPEIEKEINKK